MALKHQQSLKIVVARRLFLCSSGFVSLSCAIVPWVRFHHSMPRLLLKRAHDHKKQQQHTHTDHLISHWQWFASRCISRNEPRHLIRLNLHDSIFISVFFLFCFLFFNSGKYFALLFQLKRTQCKAVLN